MGQGFFLVSHKDVLKGKKNFPLFNFSLIGYLLQLLTSWVNLNLQPKRKFIPTGIVTHEILLSP